MRKTITITYPASPARVAAMLADPAYQKLRLERVRLTDAAVDVATRGQGFVTTITGAIPPSLLPSAAQRFIRSSVSFTLTESWGEPAEDGSRTGSLDVALKGAPVRTGATSALAPAGEEATTLTLDLNLEVTVPLMGGRIEERAMGAVDRVVADEERRAAQWLAQH